MGKFVSTFDPPSFAFANCRSPVLCGKTYTHTLDPELRTSACGRNQFLHGPSEYATALKVRVKLHQNATIQINSKGI